MEISWRPAKLDFVGHRDSGLVASVLDKSIILDSPVVREKQGQSLVGSSFYELACILEAATEGQTIQTL